METDKDRLLGEGRILVLSCDPEVGLGGQICPGRCQGWSSHGKIGIQLAPNRLKPLARRPTELFLLQGRCHTLFGRGPEGQLLLQRFAEGVNDEKADITGPSGRGRAQALPLGPGTDQLTQETIRKLTGLNLGPEGTLPGAPPSDLQPAAIEGIDRCQGLETPVGVMPPDGRRTGPDPKEHGSIQAGIPLKGQGLEGELTAAREVSLDKLRPAFCANGKPQIR